MGESLWFSASVGVEQFQTQLPGWTGLQARRPRRPHVAPRPVGVAPPCCPVRKALLEALLSSPGLSPLRRPFPDTPRLLHFLPCPRTRAGLLPALLMLFPWGPLPRWSPVAPRIPASAPTNPKFPE